MAESDDLGAPLESGPPQATDAEPNEHRPTRLEVKAAKLEAKAAKARAAEAARVERQTEPVGSTRSRTVAAIVALLACALALAAAFYALHERSAANRAHELDRVRASAMATAQKYAVDFGSYDYKTLNDDFARVTAHLTPEFAKSYSSVATKLDAVIQQYKGKSVGTVQGVALTSVTTSSAVALVFLDQTVTTSQSSQSRVDRNRLQMTMVRQKDGSWLISDLQLK